MTEPQIDRAIARVKAGCVEDYAAVVGAYHERLRATLATYCPPGVEVDEIAHLAFVAAYRQLARYTPGTNFFAWLCAIARHRLMTECEALRRQARNRDNYFQYLLIERLQLEVQRETVFDDSRLQFLEECLRALSPEARSLIEGRYGQRSTVRSLAAALGRTATAVSVQLFGLRQKLRDCIERKRRALRAAQS